MPIFRVIVSETYAKVYEYEAKNEDDARFKWAEERGINPINKKFMEWDIIDVEDVTAQERRATP